ncbi:MAG: hypothetical protein KF788_11750 [Piscinibacter sp.]|nr:hypothetical protein [Piscinibacter sp.]
MTATAESPRLFIVRVWTDPAGTAVRGSVRDVQQETTSRFEQRHELLRLLLPPAAPPSEPADAPAPADAGARP